MASPRPRRSRRAGRHRRSHVVHPATTRMAVTVGIRPGEDRRRGRCGVGRDDPPSSRLRVDGARPRAALWVGERSVLRVPIDANAPDAYGADKRERGRRQAGPHDGPVLGISDWIADHAPWPAPRFLLMIFIV